ncbi:hypothetical protein CROQUDRAFT_89292 [Cronartium quercuum f. sp. fusiforme G11]|uniref:Uncharacterized protein n=1 Tax=Cronartium quercuum f. sp. fusiforme G11 TaxID=708437 RepID=A0A9P6NNF5_9BASI|nr:hypothetical protein CROQUDRAFT_89292 [Cronartium quercuum f. sp. fusiforme G11]
MVAGCMIVVQASSLQTVPSCSCLTVPVLLLNYPSLHALLLLWEKLEERSRLNFLLPLFHLATGAESGSERWEWEEQSDNLPWSLESLNPSKSISLKGIWSHMSAINRPAPSMLITFEIPPYGSGLTTVSGLTIDRLVVSDWSRSVHVSVMQSVKARHRIEHYIENVDVDRVSVALTFAGFRAVTCTVDNPSTLIILHSSSPTPTMPSQPLDPAQEKKRVLALVACGGDSNCAADGLDGVVAGIDILSRHLLSQAIIPSYTWA